MEQIDYAADTPRQTENTDLEEVSVLCQTQMRLEDRLEEAEAQVARIEEELRQVREKLLPDLLKAKGLSEIRLAQGHKLILEDKYFASIPVEKKERSHEWFRMAGFGDLIKNLVTLQFGKGEDNKAKQILEELSARGFAPQNNQSIHPQTLKAFVREQITNGTPPPADVVTVTIVPTVKIKRKQNDG